MTLECYRFTVTGRVQGVGFRQSAALQARRLQISGWVRNRTDGAVEGWAQGDTAALQQLRDWLQQGPPPARVDGLQWLRSDGPPVPQGIGFEIRP